MSIVVDKLIKVWYTFALSSPCRRDVLSANAHVTKTWQILDLLQHGFIGYDIYNLKAWIN